MKEREHAPAHSAGWSALAAATSAADRQKQKTPEFSMPKCSWPWHCSAQLAWWLRPSTGAVSTEGCDESAPAGGSTHARGFGRGGMRTLDPYPPAAAPPPPPPAALPPSQQQAWGLAVPPLGRDTHT